MAPAGALAHRGLAWLFILLAFVGWVLMLSGVASLQQACSGGMVTTLSDLRALAGRRRLLQNPIAPGGIPGTVGYLAPVSCTKFFSYAWWITFFNMTLLILLAAGVTTLIGRFRGGLVAISAVLLVLLMDTANTFLYFNHVNGITSKVATRARVLVAGSIISAIAYFCIIAIAGLHDEEAAVRPPYDTEAGGKKRRKVPGAGLLGSLFQRGKRHKGEGEVGAGVPGSPRMVHLPPQPAAPRPVAGSPPRTPTQPVSGVTAAATTTAVPVSTQAGRIADRS